MKRQELNNLRTKEIGELRKLIEEKKRGFLKIKAEMKVSKEKNLKRTKNIRHELAQILTVIREKEIMEGVNRKSTNTEGTEEFTENTE